MAGPLPAPPSIVTDDGSRLIVPGRSSDAGRAGMALLWDGATEQPAWGAVASGAGGGGPIGIATMSVDFTAAGDAARADSPTAGAGLYTWWERGNWDAAGYAPGWVDHSAGLSSCQLLPGLYSIEAVCRGTFTGTNRSTWAAIYDGGLDLVDPYRRPVQTNTVDAAGQLALFHATGVRQMSSFQIGPTWDTAATDPGFTGSLLLQITRWVDVPSSGGGT